jgi:cytoskeleton protein RodZ
VAAQDGVRDNAAMFEIGGSLREARLKRGLSPADVQKAIRIRDRYLQALEEERWELLPGDAYVKGFLRTYADFLGLDGNLYVDEYNNRFAHEEEPLLVPQRFARGENRRRIGLLRPVLGVGALVAIVAAVAAWQLNGSGSPRTQGSPTTTVHTTTGMTPPKKQHRKHHSTPPPVALPTRAVLVASRGDCWLWVRSGGANGPTLYEATLVQGKTLSIDLKNGPVWIDVGDPPRLDVRMGGKLVPGLPSQAGNVLLTRSGLKPA